MGDVWYFLLHRPENPTLIEFNSEADRENYRQRIIQRLGVSVAPYTVLNIHRIGIRAPVRYVFEELLQWDGDSTCWPNHLARVRRIDGRLEQIRITLCGLEPLPLFHLSALRIQRTPDRYFDNARYLLYASRGGYPMGVFCIYTRSAIAADEEPDQTQLFAVVGFNFYGRRGWGSLPAIRVLWEVIHNRVTANVLNRFKQLCEWRFGQLQERGFAGREQARRGSSQQHAEVEPDYPNS